MLGPGNSTSPVLEDSGPGEKPQLGVWNAGTGRVPGPKSRRRRCQVDWFPATPGVSAGRFSGSAAALSRLQPEQRARGALPTASA